MIDIQCPSCSAPYSVAEIRIPASGLKMRCPKCAESFMVSQSGEVSDPPNQTHQGLGSTESHDHATATARQTLQTPGAPPPPPDNAPSTQPMPAVEDLPSRRAVTDLPSSTEIRPEADEDETIDFGVIDLPPLTAGSALESDNLPSPAIAPPPPPRPLGGDDDLPARAIEIQTILPSPTAAGTSANLPSPAGGTFGADLPSPADLSFGTDLPAPSSGVASDLPASQRESFGNVALPALVAEKGDAVGGDVGGEFALDEGDGITLLGDEALTLSGEEGEGSAPLIEIKPKRSKRVRVLFAVVPLLAIAGGALSLTPVGPYGYYAISDALTRSSREASLKTFRESSHKQLGKDSYVDARGLLNSALNQQSHMTRFAPMTAYSAFLGFMMNIRFGDNSEVAANARQLLAHISDADPSMLKQLATAASNGTSDDVASSLLAFSELSQASPHDIDVAIFHGEIALKAKDAEAATSAFKRAIGIQRSARSIFGLARTQLAQNKVKEAEKSAIEILKLNKNHVGARLLLARLKSKAETGLDAATKLIEEVVSPGPVRSAASPRELIEAYSTLGDTLLKRSRASAAEKSYAEALKLDPQAHSALIGTGELFYRSGRFSEALARFQAARNRDLNNIAATVGHAKALIALERPKEAKGLLLRRAREGDHPSLRYWIGRSEEAVGDPTAAEKSYRKSIMDGAGTDEVILPYIALAKLIAADGHEEEARKLLINASQKVPKSATLHNAKGDVALQGGRLDEAKAEYQMALKLDPKNLASKFMLGVVYRRNRLFKTAERVFDEIGKIDPEYPGLALERGLLFEETGAMDRALQAYADALAMAPKDIDLKFRVGSAQVIGGHPRRAVPLLREVLREKPQSAEVNHFLGRALLLMGGAANEALPYLKAAARHDPNRAQYHLYIGWAANEAGQAVLAEKSLEKTLEIDQNLADAYWQRAVLLQKRGQTIDALEDVNIALSKRPSRYQAYATQALCHQDQADYTAAEKSWRKAISGNRSVSEWHFRLGKILFDRQNMVDGAKHVSSAISLIEADKSHAAPPWAWNAYLLLAESYRHIDKDKSIAAYRRFLKLSAPENAYRQQAKAAIKAMGGRVR